MPLHCPLCAGLIQIDSSFAGGQVACPLCRGAIGVPPADILLEYPGSEPVPPPRGELLSLACPVCAGPFQVPADSGGQHVGCPHCGSPVLIPPLNLPAAVASAAEATVVELRATSPQEIRESPKRIGQGEREIEIRRLPADEKSRRRFRRGAILWGFCLLLLVVVIVVFIYKPH
ncbi:MAG: hypothetical protein WD872_02210 [Pirellulaceae bacterium]